MNATDVKTDMKTEMTEDDVLDLVEDYFRRHQPRAYRLDVLRHGVRRDGDWWYIAVQPTPPDIAAREYSDIMEQAEDEIRAQADVKVLLLPVLPGD